MNSLIVADTGPIIAWGRMGFLDFLPDLPFEFITTIAVREEIKLGFAMGYLVDFPPLIRVVGLQNPISPLSLAGLDLGEASVIELAIQEAAVTVCIDEQKGRRAAVASGLEVVGSLGIVGRAKKLGLIEYARPFVEKAQSAGIFYNVRLVENFLKQIGE